MPAQDGSATGSATPGAALVPVHRFGFHTRDTVQAHESIRSVYVEHQPRIFGCADACVYDLQTVTTGELAADSLRYTLDVEIVTDPLRHMQADLVLNGPLSVRAGHEEVCLARGDVALVQVGVPVTARAANVNLIMIRFSLEHVTQVAARRGIDPADFRFDAMAPISPSLGRYWRDTMLYLHQSLNAPDPAVRNPLVHSAMLDMVASAAIAAFPNTTTTTAYVSGPGRVAPAAVRRAVAFIDAHAHEAITLTDIAEASRVGARGLQAAFHRHLDTTPMAYLRRVRLQRAHRDLLAGDPGLGDTVAGIAGRWGWPSPARFAAAYRTEYGQAPSRTLRV